MFFLRTINLMFSAIQTAISVVLFSDIDEIDRKPERTIIISDNVTKLFFIELFLSLLSIPTAIFSRNVFVILLSLPMTGYNLYCVFRKNYNLDFSIGEVKENRKAYYKASLQYKIKFGVYMTVTIVSFVYLAVSMMIYYLDQFLSSKTAINTIMKLIGLSD